MKVLFLVNCSDFFMSHFVRLAISIKDSGHRVCIAAGNDFQKEKIQSLGFEFQEVSLSRSGKNILEEMSSIISIYRLYNSYQPDLVHMFTIKPIIYGGIVGKLSKWVPSERMVASVTGLGSSSMSKKISGKILWKVLSLTYKYVFSSDAMNVIFENTDDRHLFVKNRIVQEGNSFIVNGAGIDIHEFSPSPIKFDRVTVILVARYLKDKGIQEYIDAGRILKESKVDVDLLLVGAVDPLNPSSMTQNEIDFADSMGYIKNLGYRTDIALYYQKSHIACLPSYREGLPKSLIEATACGLPIITTDVPGCRQVVTHSKNGLLVPVKNVVALADAIKNLATNKNKVTDMGIEGRIIAEKIYSYESVIASFFEIYGFSKNEKY